MSRVTAAQLYEVDAGVLTSARLSQGTWSFRFAGAFELDCYSGWRLSIHEGHARPVLGSRDLDGADGDYTEVIRLVVGDAPCHILSSSNLSASYQLIFVDAEGRRMTLDIVCDAAKQANFRARIKEEDAYDIENEGAKPQEAETE